VVAAQAATPAQVAATVAGITVDPGPPPQPAEIATRASVTKKPGKRMLPGFLISGTAALGRWA